MDAAQPPSQQQLHTQQGQTQPSEQRQQQGATAAASAAAPRSHVSAPQAGIAERSSATSSASGPHGAAAASSAAVTNHDASGAVAAAAGGATGVSYGAGHFLAEKAGMAGVDKQHVAEVVERMSKGSKYYANAQAKEAALMARIAEMKASVARMPTAELQRLEAQMTAEMARIEASRQLTRAWAVVDMDMFFAAVELRDNPALQGVPFAVGGMSMISTSSYEARRYGVRSAQPGFIAKQLCPQLVFVKPNFDKYTAAAAECRRVFADYDSDLSAMSLDEAFLDVTEYCIEHALVADAERQARVAAAQRPVAHASSSATEQVGPRSGAASHALAHATGAASCAAGASVPPDEVKAAEGASNSDEHGQSGHRNPSHAAPPVFDHIPSAAEQRAIAQAIAEMRARVKADTRGLTCSAGIAANPMLAKICSNANKPDGQLLLPFNRQAILDYMAPLSVRQIPGVGKVTEKILTEMGVATCADIIAKRGMIRAVFNERMSCWLLRSALGVADAERHGDEDDDGGDAKGIGRKSISCERTFRDCGDWETLKAKAIELANHVAEEMKEEDIIGKTVTIKMKLHTFEVLQKSMSLPKASNDAAVFADAALALLQAAMPVRLRLLGVRISHFDKATREKTMLDAFLERAKAAAAAADGMAAGAGATSSTSVSSASAAAAPSAGAASGAQPRGLHVVDASSASPARHASASTQPRAQSGGLDRYFKKGGSAPPPRATAEANVISLLDDDDDDDGSGINDKEERGECTAPAGTGHADALSLQEGGTRPDVSTQYCREFGSSDEDTDGEEESGGRQPEHHDDDHALASDGELPASMANDLYAARADSASAARCDAAAECPTIMTNAASIEPADATEPAAHPLPTRGSHLAAVATSTIDLCDSQLSQSDSNDEVKLVQPPGGVIPARGTTAATSASAVADVAAAAPAGARSSHGGRALESEDATCGSERAPSSGHTGITLCPVCGCLIAGNVSSVAAHVEACLSRPVKRRRL